MLRGRDRSRDWGGGGASLPFDYFPSYGQSLAGNHVGGYSVTLAQEYGAIAFDRNASTGPSALVATSIPITGGDGYGIPNAVGEGVIFGQAGMLGALGVLGSPQTRRILTGMQSYGATAIALLVKGQTYYGNLTAQITAAKALGGTTMTHRATAWYQGEADSVYASYLSALTQLGTDLDTDSRAITGSGLSHYLISYQTTTNNANTFAVPRAQLQASLDNALILISTPIYFMDSRGDPTGLHLLARDAKWLGAYAALAYKKRITDNVAYSCLRPISSTGAGTTTITLTFTGNVGNLVFDTTHMPAQTNMGFTAEDLVGTAIAVNSVTITGANTVAIVLATAMVAGGAIKYAMNVVSGLTIYPGTAYEVTKVGGGGNLRDSQGDTIFYTAINKRMDKWSVLFKWVV